MVMQQVEPGAPVPEAVGRHVLLRSAQDPVRERAFLTRLPELPGRQFVLLARDVARRVDPPTIYGAMRAAARNAGYAGDLREIWLGVEGLAVRPDLIAALARESGLDVVGPIGRLAFASGSAVFASGDGGARGWWRSAGGAAPVPDGWRFPPRVWEDGMPASSLTGPEATVSAVMAGVSVRDGGAPPAGPGDLAFHVVGDQDAVRVVVDDPCPTPEAVARLLTQLPGKRAPVVVALTPTASEPGWLDALRAAAGRAPTVAPAPTLVAADGTVREVVLGASRQELFDPFPIKLRLLAGGHETVAIAPPPPGWVVAGSTAYAAEDPAADGVRAHVVANGLVMSRLPALLLGPARRFDPSGWTLEIGQAGEPVDRALVRAANDLLAGLTPPTRSSARVLMTGVPPAEADPPQAPGPTSAPTPTPVAAPQPVPPPTPTTAAAPVPAPPPPARSLPPLPSPIATSSSGPGAIAEPDRSLLPRVEHLAPDPAPAPVAPVTEERIPATALVVIDRDSTVAEQARFAAAAGEAFTEAIAVVNAAMATWPALRRDGNAGAKADLAAVCLYLGGHAGTRAGDVEDAVRRGTEGVVDGHLGCLVSGLRRLPVHRRPVLRQGVDEVGAEQGTPGRLLGDPGFLTASTDLAVTVADARYDVLIMPATARRAAELVGGEAVAEVVFPAGSRYRTLGMRTHDDDLRADAAPRTALLLRELAPDEEPTVAEELDARDRAALSRLERALAGRRRAAVHVVDEPAVVARLTRRMAVVVPDEVAARPRTGVPDRARSGGPAAVDAGR
jgi:hypothetical protein